jgi:enoyl-CoA hydratase/carnithine racemase
VLRYESLIIGCGDQPNRGEWRSMTQEPVYLKIDGAIAQLILNRPDKRNALTRAMWAAIREHAAAVAANPEVNVLVLRGATPASFAAGADIAEFEEVFASTATAHAYHSLIHAAYDALADLAVPTMAMVQGVCFGGGCALALCCDLRYADDGATFCIPPARLGLAYSLAETRRLMELVGPSQAKEMLMGARVIAADEALRIGLVTRVFGAADLERETMAFADVLCGLSQFSIRATKAVIRDILDGAVAETATSQRLFEEQFQSADYIEGRKAFLEKRTPNFT